MIVTPPDEHKGDVVYRELDYLSACFLFMASRIVRVEPRMLPSSAQLSSSGRLPSPRPLVRTVHLRRLAEGPTKLSPTDGVDWSCRWVVSAHWRQQYYPSTGDHRPVLVLPYMKGPQDRPLKPPRATLYAVDR
jgi:hypothetical protein